MLILSFSVVTLVVVGMVFTGGHALTDQVINFNMYGTYSWQLILNVDNSDNAGFVRREVEVVTSVFCSYENMVRTMSSSTVAASTGVDLGGTLFEVLSIGVKGSLSSEVKSEYEQITTNKKEVMRKTTKKDTYEVGPGSKLKLYQLVFSGPGISYVTDTISTDPKEQPTVPIEFKVKQVYVLQDIEVVYTDDSVSRPNYLITEVHGENPDINKGFGGKYVWLVPKWTKMVKDGASGIQIAVQGHANHGYKDLAKGAGGDYRYLKILRDPYSKGRITEIGLWRSGQALEGSGPGWQYRTGDINQGRKKDYLYLVYNKRNA